MSTATATSEVLTIIDPYQQTVDTDLSMLEDLANGPDIESVNNTPQRKEMIMSDQPKWLTVTEAKVSYAPIKKMVPNKNGDLKEKTSFMKLGVKITMACGDIWFHHFRYDSWTRRTPGPIKRYPSGTPIMGDDGNPLREKEQKQRWANTPTFHKQMKHCQRLIDVLTEAEIQAVVEDEAKRAA